MTSRGVGPGVVEPQHGCVLTQSVVLAAEIHNTLAFQEGIGRVSVKRAAALWLIRKIRYS
jgi:hypothetical protein